MKKAVILAILFLPVLASASFTPASWQYPGNSDTDYSFGKGGLNEDMMMSHTATTTLAGVNGFEPYLCRYLGTGIGTITLSVWYNGTTSPYTEVASSTINQSAVVPCIANGVAFYGSSTPFVLNRSFNTNSGDTLYFKLKFENGDGTIYMRGDNTVTATHFPWYSSSTTGQYLYTGKPIDTFGKITSGLGAYSTTWADLVQSAKESNTCDGIFECAFAWAFYPSNTTLDELRNVNIASTTPFGYIYSIRNLFNTYGTTSTSTASIQVNLATFVGNYATGSTTIPILSSSGMQTVLGTSTWNMLQTIITYMLWLGFMWYVYRRATSII